MTAQAPASSTPLGKISFPNSGSAAAQAPFVRGVLLLHSFEYDDAIAAFREAQRIDPAFALAYWGEALSYTQPLWENESVDKARAALGRLGATAAARAAKAPTAREKGYLQAVERLYGEGSKVARTRAYADRMGELAGANPSDEEAAAFHALALLATIPSGQRNAEVSLKAGAIASGILTRNPQHPGAAHYALHAYDDGEHAAMGLEAARLYAKIAPASSHARHMPSHVFLPLGMWDEAVASDESAYQASVDRARARGLSAAQHDFHALGWLHYEYLQQGRFAKAQGLVALVDRAMRDQQGPPKGGHYGRQDRDDDPRMAHVVAYGDAHHVARVDPLAYVVSGFSRTTADQHQHVEYVVSGFSRTNADQHQHIESEIGRGFGAVSLKSERASMRARLIVESGTWELMRGQGSFDNVDELFALAIASVKLGDRARAEAALGQLQGARSAAPDADNKRLAEIMYREAGGLYQILRGEKAEGLAALASAAGIEAEMPRPIARPYPIKPAGELYGEALLAAGDAAGAVRAFQAALARTPRRAASLVGLARAAAAAKQPALASRTARELMAMWRLADADRGELAELRAIAR